MNIINARISTETCNASEVTIFKVRTCSVMELKNKQWNATKIGEREEEIMWNCEREGGL